MKKLLLMAAGAALLAGPAFAVPVGPGSPAGPNASASDTLNIIGNADTVCTLDTGALNTATSGTTFNSGTETVTIAGGSFTSDSNADLLASSADLHFAGMCNYAHTISLKSLHGGLDNTTTGNDPVSGSGAFIQHVGYAATATWAGSTDTLTNPSTTAKADGTDLDNQASIGGAYQGTLDLNIAITAVGTPVVAGVWEDQLTVQIGAAL